MGATRAGVPIPGYGPRPGPIGKPLAAGLLLPVFAAGGVTRFKRLTMLVDPTSVVRAVQFPVTDPAGSVDEVLALARDHATIPG
ncbi:hypothetical protein ACLQ24_24270 [Micromonospora sp. DT4]|uniref:hypothetical protein n=1 Tax=Micromonospora sp. DT4 TaxID=3393438 RepID=UPI003CF3E2CD